MSTGDLRVETYTGKILSAPETQLRFFDVLEKYSADILRNVFNYTGGLFDPVNIAAGGANDQITLDPVKGFDTDGELVLSDGTDWQDYLEDVPFENQTGVTYYVGVAPVKIPYTPEINQRTSEAEYYLLEEAIGWLSEPYEVVNNGSTLTITLSVDGGSSPVADQTGRTVFVWLKRALTTSSDWREEAVAVYDVDRNKITTTGLLGQGAGLHPVSTDPQDYMLLFAGPVIAAGDISSDPEIIFIGTVEGNGPGASPTVFDTSGQTVFYIPNDNALNILQLARDLYTSPVLNGDGIAILPEPLQTTVATNTSDIADNADAISDNYDAIVALTNGVDDGSAIGDDAIVQRHIGDDEVHAEHINTDVVDQLAGAGLVRNGDALDVVASTLTPGNNIGFAGGTDIYTLTTIASATDTTVVSTEQTRQVNSSTDCRASGAASATLASALSNALAAQSAVIASNTCTVNYTRGSIVSAYNSSIGANAHSSSIIASYTSQITATGGRHLIAASETCYIETTIDNAAVIASKDSCKARGYESAVIACNNQVVAEGNRCVALACVGSLAINGQMAAALACNGGSVNGTYCAALASNNCTVTGLYSQANASSGSYAAQKYAQVNASSSSYAGSSSEAYGPELVTNGLFTTDLSGWTVVADPGAIYWDSGTCKLTGLGLEPRMYQDVAVTSGKQYLVKFDITYNSGGCNQYCAGWAQHTCCVIYFSNVYLGQVHDDFPVGSYSFLVTATTGSDPLGRFWFGGGGPTSDEYNIDNVSVREIGEYNQVNACAGSSAIGLQTAITASLYSKTNGSRQTVLSSSYTLAPATGADFTVCGGYHASGPMSSANRTWQLDSQTGTIHCKAAAVDTSWTASDYAEFFESFDGNEIPLGTLVTLNGDKIQACVSGDLILGAISATAAVTLGAQSFCWGGRFLEDDFGAPVLEEVVDPEYDGDPEDPEAPKIWVKSENPEYNPDEIYIPRQDREEWHNVGLVGQLLVRCDDTLAAGDYIEADDNGHATKVASGTGQNFRVMKITKAYNAEDGYGVAKVFIR